jgi:hypothetical protein
MSTVTDASCMTFSRAEHGIADATVDTGTSGNPTPVPSHDLYDPSRPWSTDVLPEHRVLNRRPAAVTSLDVRRTAGVVVLKWSPPIPAPSTVKRYRLQCR